jgi:hypothetical protein
MGAASASGIRRREAVASWLDGLRQPRRRLRRLAGPPGCQGLPGAGVRDRQRGEPGSLVPENPEQAQDGLGEMVDDLLVHPLGKPSSPQAATSRIDALRIGQSPAR